MCLKTHFLCSWWQVYLSSDQTPPGLGGSKIHNFREVLGNSFVNFLTKWPDFHVSRGVYQVLGVPGPQNDQFDGGFLAKPLFFIDFDEIWPFWGSKMTKNTFFDRFLTILGVRGPVLWGSRNPIRSRQFWTGSEPNLNQIWIESV